MKQTLFTISIGMVLLLGIQNSSNAQKNNTNRTQEALPFYCEPNKNYLLIEGVKYYDGEEYYACAGTYILSIKAFHKNEQPFPNNTDWINVQVGSGNQATIDFELMPLDEEVFVEASYTNGTTTEQVSVKFIAVDVTFDKAPAPPRRFDKNEKGEYQQYKDTNPNGLPYKGLKLFEFETVKVKVTPATAYDKVELYLEPGNQIVVPTTLSHSQQLVSLYSNSLLSNPPLKVKVDGKVCLESGLVNVTYEKLSKPVYIIPVHEQNDDVQLTAIGDSPSSGQACIGLGANEELDTAIPNDSSIDDEIGTDGLIYPGPNGVCEVTANDEDVINQITDILDYVSISNRVNDIYDEALFGWNWQILPPVSIHYDLNRDGYLDSNHPEDAPSNEMDEVRNNCQVCPDDPNAHIVFVLDNVQPGGNHGFNKIGTKYAYVYPNTVEANYYGEPFRAKVIAHELGHGLSLRHISDNYDNNDTKPCMVTDHEGAVLNLMRRYHPDSHLAKKIRKFQWDLLHGIPCHEE